MVHNIYEETRINSVKQDSNPYIYGPPVSGNQLIGRESIIQTIITKALPPNPVPLLIRGEPRIGKTSLLQEVERQLNESSDNNYRALLISLEFLRPFKLEDFIYNLSATIANSLDEYSLGDIPDKFFLEGEESSPQKIFMQSFLPTVFEVTQSSQIVLIFEEETVDSFENVSPQMTEFLKNLFEKEKRLTPIFNLASKNFETLGFPFRKLCKSSELILLKTLSFDKTRELITSFASSLLKYEQDAIRKIWKLAHGHPCLTQLICHNVYDAVFTAKNELDEQLKPVNTSVICGVIPDVFTSGEPIFDSIWQSFNTPQQLLLSALAILYDSNQYSNYGVPESSIVKKIRDQDIDEQYSNLSKEFMQLTQRQVLKQHSNNNIRHYRFHVDLLRMWILEKKPLNVLAYELINSGYLTKIKNCERLWAVRRELIKVLHYTEIKAAKFGIAVPSDVSAQLTFLREEIQKNQEELESLNCESMRV